MPSKLRRRWLALFVLSRRGQVGWLLSERVGAGRRQRRAESWVGHFPGNNGSIPSGIVCEVFR